MLRMWLQLARIPDMAGDPGAAGTGPDGQPRVRARRLFRREPARGAAGEPGRHPTEIHTASNEGAGAVRPAPEQGVIARGLPGPFEKRSDSMARHVEDLEAHGLRARKSEADPHGCARWVRCDRIHDEPGGDRSEERRVG